MTKNFIKQLGTLLGNENFFAEKNAVPILVIFVAGLLFAMYAIPYFTQQTEKTAADVTEFVKSKFPAEVQITLSGYEEVNGVLKYNYTIGVEGQTQEMILYSDLKGEMLFPESLEITEGEPVFDEGPVVFDAPDTATPEVELFIMAFCPYGTQAEDAFIPVVDALNDNSNIHVRYILNDDGQGTITSLHGQPEVDEAARQLCVLEKFGKVTLWDYLERFNSECVDLSTQTAYAQTLENAEQCSNDLVKDMGLDVSEFESCVEDDSQELLITHALISKTKQVGGSPTLIINDARYDGARAPNAYKDAICSGFGTEPAVCDQALSVQTAAASGSC